MLEDEFEFEQLSMFLYCGPKGMIAQHHIWGKKLKKAVGKKSKKQSSEVQVSA